MYTSPWTEYKPSCKLHLVLCKLYKPSCACSVPACTTHLAPDTNYPIRGFLLFISCSDSLCMSAFCVAHLVQYTTHFVNCTLCFANCTKHLVPFNPSCTNHLAPCRNHRLRSSWCSISCSGHLCMSAFLSSSPCAVYKPSCTLHLVHCLLYKSSCTWANHHIQTM